MRGRKPKQESRAAEIRARLAAWKQTPEVSRRSLRALARDLGTSHQLLGHYLKHWEKWQFKEYGRRREEIWARVKAEDRPITPWEEQQVYAYNRAQARAFAHYTILEQVEKIKREAKRGPLGWYDIKALKIFARAGVPEAQELLQTCSQDALKRPRAKKAKRASLGQGASATSVRGTTPKARPLSPQSFCNGVREVARKGRKIIGHRVPLTPLSHLDESGGAWQLR